MKGFVNQVVVLVSFLLFCACTAHAQTIVPTQTDEIIIDNGTSGKADPGDRIRYKVTIQNTGGPAGTGVQLNIVPDLRTNFVMGTFKSTPLAVPDVYTCTGNVGINVPAASGVKTNDFDDDLAGATLSVTTPPTNGTATLNNDGSFTYTPNAGFNGMDVFTYTMTDVTPVPAAPTTDATTVTITVSNMIWFVDNTGGGSGGTGTLTNPFKTLTNFNASALPLAGHVVFVKHSGTVYRGGIVLKNNMYLFGTGHSGGSNLADSGVLPFTVAVNSPALPAINGARTVIINDNLNGVSPYYGITLASGNTIRGVEVGRCDGIKIFGSNFGTLTIGNTTNPDVALSGRRTTLDLTNGAFAATSKFAFINSLDSSILILNTVSGSLASGSTAVNAQLSPIAIDIQNSSAALDFGSTIANHFVGGTVISITNSGTGSVTFSNLSMPYIGNGVGLIANAGGTIHIGGTASDITARTALNITNTSFGAGATFASITANNFFASPGVNLNNVTGGPVVINGGSISSIFATANAFDVNAGSSDISYAGTISYTGTSSARTVEVGARTGGTVTFSGNISANTGTGINVASNTGGTVVFSGASKNLSTGASNAVTLTTNTGSTINFSNGGLVLATTSGTGFSATGGGTVTVTKDAGTDNTINSTGATALNVTSTTIGSGGLNFLSISSNNATKGIVLNTTGNTAGLAVTGTGTTDGSGGTIQNMSTRGGEFISTINLSLKNMNFTNANTSNGGTCTDLSTSGCNAAIYLNSVSTVTLDNINITGTTAQEGINGLTVSNFILANSTITNTGNAIEEGCIKMRELTGTCAITNCDLAFPGQDVVEIVNTTGPGLLLNVNSSQFRDSQSSASGGNGLQVRSEGTASVIFNVNSSNFLRIRTNGIQATAINSASNDVDITGSIFDPGAGTMIGLDLDADNTGILKFNVQNNPMIYSRNGPAINVFGDVNAVIDGRINNNPDVQVKSNIGSNVGSGIRANLNKDASGRIEVKNNVVNVGSDDAGIDLTGIGKVSANPGGATKTLNATVTGNNVTIGATSTYGIFIISASNASDNNAICVNVANNSVTRNPSSTASFRARVPSATGFFFMQGFVTNAEATWNGNGNTPMSAGGSEVSFGGSGTFGSCTTVLPTNPALTPSN